MICVGNLAYRIIIANVIVGDCPGSILEVVIVRIPSLRSPENPTASKWHEFELGDAEARHLRRHLALMVGYDPETKMVEKIGSGFNIGTVPFLLFMTSSNVLIQYTNRVLGPLDSTQLADEVREQEKRICQMFDSGRIKVIVEFADSSGVRAVDVAEARFGDSRYNDYAVLRALEYDEFREHNFLNMPMDFQPIDGSEQFVMAGFSGSGEAPISDVPSLARLRVKLVVRAAGVVPGSLQASNSPVGSLGLRVDMPCEPGMAGGPLFRVRTPLGEPRFPGHKTPEIFASVGIIRGKQLDGMTENSQSADQTTLVTPLLEARCPVSFQDIPPYDPILDTCLNYQDVEPTLKALPPNYERGMEFDPVPLLKAKLKKMGYKRD